MVDEKYEGQVDNYSVEHGRITYGKKGGLE